MDQRTAPVVPPITAASASGIESAARSTMAQIHDGVADIVPYNDGALTCAHDHKDTPGAVVRPPAPRGGWLAQQ